MLLPLHLNVQTPPAPSTGLRFKVRILSSKRIAMRGGAAIAGQQISIRGLSPARIKTRGESAILGGTIEMTGNSGNRVSMRGGGYKK